MNSEGRSTDAPLQKTQFMKTLSDLAAQLNIPAADIIRAADQHTLAVQAWLSSRAPQAGTFVGKGVRASATGIGVPLLNLALGAAFPPDTSDAELDAEIEAVKTFFAERSVLRWYWWLGVTCQPPDMAARLEQHDLIFDRPELPAMVAPLNADTRYPAYDPAIRVWQAASIEDLEHASTIRRTAFRFPDGVARDYFEAMPDSWLSTEGVRLYLAAIDAQPPASIGALIIKDGFPGVYVMATLPEHGRRGLGKAILTRIMADAAAEGHSMIILTASRMGAALYSQFGFVRAFDYAIYRPIEGS